MYPVEINNFIILLYIFGIVAVIGGSSFIYIFCKRRRVKNISSVLLVAITVLALYIPVAQLLKYYSLHFFADFSHWLQVLYQIGMRGAPLSPNVAFFDPPFGNYFAAHFVPFVYLLAIPFKFLPHAGTIIVINALLMFSSVIPLYKIALKLSENRRFSFLVSVLLLWYPTFQYITLYEFEMLRFSIPVLFWMIYFFETRRTALYFVFVLLAVLVREEVGLTIFMFGLYVWFFKKQRRLGILTAVFGIGALFVIVGAVMPAFNTSDSFTHQVAAGSLYQWGSTLPEIVINIATHPTQALKTMLSAQKFVNVFMLLLPLLIIPLAAPGALMGVFASIGIGLISASPLHSSYMLYYVSPAIPFLFYAFIKAWPKLVERFRLVHPAAMCAVLAGLLMANIWFGPSPISLQFWLRDIRPAPFRTQSFHFSVYRVNPHHKKADEFVRMTPEDAVVSAQEFLQPRLFKKKGAMVFPRLISKDGLTQAEYVLLDITHNNLPPESPVVFEVTQEALSGVMDNPGMWELIDSDGEYFLYKRIDRS